VLARKRLATALRELREARGHTLDHVAGRLMISASKLSRLEKAQGLPQLRDVRDLIELYELSDTPDGDRLMRWAREGRRKGWWVDFDDVLSPDQHEFVGYENEATTCLAFAIPIVHGLLQTPAYARALVGHIGPSHSDEEIDRIVKTRTIRQQNLSDRAGASPLEFRVVLHEICLTQSVGSDEALTEQLESLLMSVKTDNVDLRILPSSSPIHIAATSMWQHFSFGEDIDRDVVFVETTSGFRYIEDEQSVRRHERWFADLVRRSLDREQSIARIADALAERR
jgi:transcriptional regulator with XRE-family HTH domain